LDDGNPEILIAARGLACERGGTRVFDNFDVTLHKGECIELRGPNGAGKSSLLRLLAGFMSPAGGSLQMPEPATATHSIGHLDAIKLALTVRENIAFWQGLMAGDSARALAAFNLQSLADEPTQFLSQGQRRRLALSRLALVHRPIWLLDEPASGLDIASLETLRTLMNAHLETGGGIIAATHVDLGLTSSTLTMAGRP
jgi:heme exporter protein A